MGQLSTDHHAGKTGGGFLARIALPGHPARAQYRRALAQRTDFVELVADVENAASLAAEPAQCREKLFHRLRRQHRRRLVHDQQLRLLQQAAHDLDPLPFAHGHRMHVAAWIERQTVALGNIANALVEGGVRFAGFERERDVLAYRQRLEQRKMLEYHADAQRPRPRWTGDRNHFAVPAYGSRVRPDDAVDDLHQGRFAGAVFAQDGVDLSGHDAEVDAVVGNDRRIDLGDALELEPR